MAHPCRGSRASVVRISRSSVPCGRSVWGIGIIRDPLYFDKRLARLMSKCKTSATGFEDSELHRIVPDGWPRDSPFEIALATRSDRNHEWVREMMGPRRSKEQTHSIFQQPWGYHDSRLLVEKYIAWVAIARIPVSFANILVAVPRVVVAGIRCPFAPEFDPVDVEVVRVLIAVSRIIPTRVIHRALPPVARRPVRMREMCWLGRERRMSRRDAGSQIAASVGGRGRRSISPKPAWSAEPATAPPSARRRAAADREELLEIYTVACRKPASTTVRLGIGPSLSDGKRRLDTARYSLYLGFQRGSRPAKPDASASKPNRTWIVRSEPLKTKWLLDQTS